MRAALPAATAILAGFITPAAAQVDTETTPGVHSEELAEPVRRYTVELIVFSYRDDASGGTEIWLPDQPPVGQTENDTVRDYGDSRFSRFSAADEALTEIEPPPLTRRYMDLDFALLRPDEYSMNGIYDKLKQVDAYEPILRAGWTQVAFDKEVTGPIDLQTLAAAPPWLTGSLTLYRGRFLHLVVDLTMNADRQAAASAVQPPQGVVRYGDARPQNQHDWFDEYGAARPAPIHFRIAEDRIMKNGDIRYFDHPKFGVIAKVTRVEEAGDDDVIDDTDDLLPASPPGP